MKVITVIGARPQFIKAAIVSKNLRLLNKIEEKIVHTGQHYDSNMSDVFFNDMEIPQPSYNLDIGSHSHGAQTGRMLEKIEEVLLTEKPDYLLVYGDTNSTLAGALAAAKLHVKVGHVEAGLRSFNKKMPEELNRILTDHLCDHLFAPTEAAVNNLINEGVAKDKIFLTGDVMYDAALFYARWAESKDDNIIKALGLDSKDYLLATIHRAENTDSEERLKAIFEGLSMVSEKIPVVMPLHPRTEAKLKEKNMIKILDGITKIIKPVGYLDMLLLEKNSRLIVTDSGGIQKEAYFFKVPCATLRTETEWVELVEVGWNKCFISNCNYEIKEFILSMVDIKGKKGRNHYGDGIAAYTISKLINKLLIT